MPTSQMSLSLFVRSLRSVLMLRDASDVSSVLAFISPSALNCCFLDFLSLTLYREHLVSVCSRLGLCHLASLQDLLLCDLEISAAPFSSIPDPAA